MTSDGDMTDQEFADQKARVQRLITKWHDTLGLKWWTVHYEYARARQDMPEGHQGEEVLAVCAVDWRYLTATMTWNLRRLSDVDDVEAERAFVHECMHILVREMRADVEHRDENDISHEERVCSTLANAFLWTRQGVA